MKTIVRTAGIALLCLTLTLSLCSCSMLKSIRENAEALKNRVFIDTPEDKDLPALYETALNNAFANSRKVQENVSYAVRDAKVQSDAGQTERLAQAAGTLTKMIMAGSPGKSEREVKTQAETLLRAVAAGEFSKADTERVTAAVNVTNEAGKNVILGNGEAETYMVNRDNILTLTVRFYTEEPDPDSDDPEAKRAVPLEASVIEAYFGAPADEAEVLKNFDSLGDYIKAEGYAFTYDNCYLTAKIDLEKQTLLSVSLHKNIKVTAQATGVGATAELGQFTVTFRVEKTTDYSFTYTSETDA